MFRLRKKEPRERTRVDGKLVYKQVAVTPEAHEKLNQMAAKNETSVIETVDRILKI